MTEKFETLCYYTVMTAIFWPWSVAAFDLGTWMMTGNQATSITWASVWGVLLVLWPVLVLLTLGALIDLIPDDYEGDRHG